MKKQEIKEKIREKLSKDKGISVLWRWKDKKQSTFIMDTIKEINGNYINMGDRWEEDWYLIDEIEIVFLQEKD